MRIMLLVRADDVRFVLRKAKVGHSMKRLINLRGALCLAYPSSRVPLNDTKLRAG